MKKFFKFGCFGFIGLIVIIIIIAIASGGGDDTTKDTSNNGTSTSQEKSTDDQNSENQVVKDDSSQIKPGTYKIGTDLPSGEYLVIANNIAYIECASNSTGELDSIIFNQNLTKGSHSYVTINDGEYFKLQGAVMYPVDKAPSVVPKDGLYMNGMFKVGQDIPAGEYKVILDSSTGMGYLEVSSNSSHQLDSIVTNENVQADMYITVTDGQYLTLQGVKIQK